MKALKWFFVLALVLGIVLVVGALLISPTYRVERTVTINAPPSKIYPLIASPKVWPRWTVWSQRDPGMKMSFSGAESGTGAKWAWEDKDGKGHMEFTHAEPDRAIRYRLDFPDMSMSSTGALTLTPADNATRVSWTNEGDMGFNLVGRWFVPFMDGMMGPDFEAGLANLKSLAEKG